MAGLDPAIHVSLTVAKTVDARHKAGHDGVQGEARVKYSAQPARLPV
jgi:hypothetical protein